MINNLELLKQVCKVPGAPGYEQKIRQFIIDQVTPMVDEVRLDAMGNVIAIKKGVQDKKVMVAAHMDEIGFIVTHIDDNGFLRFHTLGGFDPKTLTAQRVIIHGKEDVIGVMGTKPVHVLTPEEKSKAPKITEYFIDTGLSVDQVKHLIEIGSTITREREMIVMGDCVNAKSLDNRVSVFVLLEALSILKGQEVPYDVYGVFTVQEEVGIRGAISSSSGINPDFGIAIDVTMAYDLPGAQSHEKVSSLGHGAAIKILDGMTICDYRMVNYMKHIAKKKAVKYQMEILPAGGTDTAGIQRSAPGGSIAGAISIPTRYLHQVIEMAHMDDITAAIQLLVECLKGLHSYDWSFS
jgi:endoglucanase